MALDSAAAYEEALALWPMPRVLTHYGMGQFLPPKQGGNYKNEPCPFCGRKGKFSAFTKKGDGKWLVKCQIDRPTPCELNKAMDEIGLIQWKEGLPDRKTAYMRFLELAGVVIEKAPVPVVQPAPQAAQEPAPVVVQVAQPRWKPYSSRRNPKRNRSPLMLSPSFKGAAAHRRLHRLHRPAAPTPRIFGPRFTRSSY